MSTYTIEELDHEEIEFLPPRVVMCASSPCCCRPTVQIYVNVRIGCLLWVNGGVAA